MSYGDLHGYVLAVGIGLLADYVIAARFDKLTRAVIGFVLVVLSFEKVLGLRYIVSLTSVVSALLVVCGAVIIIKAIVSERSK